MKEYEFLKIIKKISDNKYLGDDCAFLKDLGIVITQDNFIENIHFKTDWSTPYQIGYKAAAINISDILASGAKPAYITVGLSLPPYINNDFIENLYKGIIDGAYGAEIIGGDITGGEKIAISITAIGKTLNRKISSRSNAQKNHVVIISSEHGKSLKGLQELLSGIKKSINITEHLEPKLDIDFSNDISTQITENYAMMDTSDGLADALFQIAKASNCSICVDNINGIYGTEDYKLVATVPEDFLPNIKNYIKIGTVKDFKGYYLKIGNNKFIKHEELNLFDHFKK